MPLTQDTMGLYWLVLARVSGVVAIAPVLSSGTLPTTLRALLSLVLAFALLAIASPPAGGVPQALGPYAGLVVHELAVGLVLGLVARVIWSAAEMAGGLLDLQSGFALATLLNPASGEATTLLSTYFNLLLTVIYLVSGGFALFLWVIGRSYQVLPVGAAAFFGPALSLTSAALDQAMLIAVTLALPAIALGLLTNVVLGLFGRAVPQLNPLQVAMPAQILLTLAVLFVVMPHLVTALASLGTQVSQWAGHLLVGGTPG